MVGAGLYMPSLEDTPSTFTLVEPDTLASSSLASLVSGIESMTEDRKSVV